MAHEACHSPITPISKDESEQVAESVCFYIGYVRRCIALIAMQKIINGVVLNP